MEQAAGQSRVPTVCVTYDQLVLHRWAHMKKVSSESREIPLKTLSYLESYIPELMTTIHVWM